MPPSAIGLPPEVFVPTFASVADRATAGAKTDRALTLRADHLIGAEHHQDQPT